ncbi:MAG TPA: MarR family transcriptional regulator [Streptosporangiaceae bacterium]|nr:MarR family transcriptional regulator [Streptosporangiaceae bacterium]
MSAPSTALATSTRVTRPRTRDARTAEQIRLGFAEAWGEMGAAWGIPPSVARVHGYILAHTRPLTEREVREALGLSHRAASLALAECVDWGLVERVPDPHRVGRRGPSAVAYAKVGDHWVWFQRIAEQRKLRETDPILPLIESARAEAEAVAATTGPGSEVEELREWLTEFEGFVRLFDRAVALVARAETAQLARGFAVLARLSDDTLDRLLRLFGSLPEEELARTLEGISRVSPATARRVLKAADRVARLGR